MRSLPASVLAKFDEGRISIRGLMRFDFGTGSYGFWTGNKPFVFGGLTYLPGSVIEVQPVTSNVGMQANEMQITLAESSEDGITPEVLATIEQEDYHQRPVTIYDMFIDPDNGTVLFVEPVYRGYIDTVQHISGTQGKLVANCESRALDNSRSGYRMRSNADQMLVQDGDKFFEFAETAGRIEVNWGREKS